MHRYFTRSKKNGESSSGDSLDSNSPNSPLRDFNTQHYNEQSDIEDIGTETDGENSFNDTVIQKFENSEPNQIMANPNQVEGAAGPAPLPAPAPRQVSRLDREFALKFILEFSGRRDKLHKFINCCDILDLEYSESDSFAFLSIIKSKLTGTAYNIIKYKEFSDWTELRQLLQDQFLELRTLTQIQTELVNSKQGYRESVRSFANRIEKLLSDLNDACIASEGLNAASVITNLNSKTELKAFVERLHPSLKLIIKASRFDRLNDAIEAAVEEEKSSSHTSKPNRPPIKCSLCHRLGHTSSTCFSKSNTSFPRNNYSFKKPEIKQELQHNIRVLKCNYCKNIGHLIKDCRKRAYNEKNRNRNINLNEGTKIQEESVQGNGGRPGATGGATRAGDLRTMQ